MSERERFLSRWSRRKQEAAKEPDDVSAAKDLAADVTAESAASGAPNASPPPQESDAAPFDPETLPSIDSIDSATDLRAFLAPGVPADLTRAALRRAWSADPAIRDFVGLSENAWDFNATDAAHGFGPLDSDTVQRLVRHFLGETPAESETQDQAQQAVEDVPRVDDEGDVAAPEAPETARVMSALARNQAADEADTAAQHEEADAQKATPRPRRHGGALPS